MALTLIDDCSLRAFLTDKELDAFDQYASEGAHPDRVGALILTNCDMVAGYVNASGRYPLLKPGTRKVPAELVHPTLALIRHSLMADMPNMSDLEGSLRAKEYDRACKLLDEVAAGKFALSPYGDEPQEQTATVDVYVAGEPYQDWSNI